MGTNYYLYTLKKPIKAEDGITPQSFNTWHIGKSSFGWVFSLHVDPHGEIKNLEDLKARLDSGVIQDEYGAILTPKEMLSIILDRCYGNYCGDESKIKGVKTRVDYMGEPYPVHAKFKTMFRHIIDGRHCVGHSSPEETYDLIVGEFS